jgi:uracil-DNA glycosylase
MAAVCRCFPGKKPGGGDRVPHEEEITRCAYWLDAELQLLRPSLIVPIGKLAINQFLPAMPLTETIGKAFPTTRAGVHFDVIPLPHPSGASPWHRMEPGKTLLIDALQQIRQHPAWLTRTERA